MPQSDHIVKIALPDQEPLDPDYDPWAEYREGRPASR